MAYCTVADVRQALAPDGSNSATLGTAASLDDGDLTDHIAEAQAEVDSKLAKRYTVPFDSGDIPDLVVKITRDIAGYLATLTYRRNQPLPDGDPVALRYARALALLNAAAKGDIDLVGDDGEIGQAAEAYVVNTLGIPEGSSLFDLAGFNLSPGYSVPWQGWE